MTTWPWFYLERKHTSSQIVLLKDLKTGKFKMLFFNCHDFLI